jgi:hypothetical protein
MTGDILSDLEGEVVPVRRENVSAYVGAHAA